MTDTTPQNRQKAIQEILTTQMISDQMQLVKILKQHFKIETNQAVVSRDLRRLGVVKRDVNGVMVYELPGSDINTQILKLAVMSIEHNGFMIIIKTHPGLAAFVGDWLDQHTDLDIMGSLAGENIVFVSPRSIPHIERIYQGICQRMHFKNKGK